MVENHKPNNCLPTAEILDVRGTQAALVVTSVPQPVRCGLTNLVKRTSVTAYNNSLTDEIYWGFDSTVTVLSGTPIRPRAMGTWKIGPNIDVWLVSSGSIDVRITESF